MSTEFLEFNFPCKECLVNAACQTKPNVEMNETRNNCLTLPKFSSEMSYSKSLIECYANLGVNIINKMSKTEDPKTSMETNNKIPMQYVMLLGQITYLLQWIVNSTSWELGILKDFDQKEIRRKCKHITL